MRFGLRLPSFALGDRDGVARRRWAPTCGGPRTSGSRGDAHRSPARRAARLPHDLARADLAAERAGRRDADDPPRHARARAAVPRSRRVREGVGDARRAVGRALDPRRRRRLDGEGVRGRRDPDRERGRADERDARADHRAVGPGRRVTYEGRYYRVDRPPARPEARAAAAPADLDRRRDAAVREDLRPAASRPSSPSCARIAKYAKTWVPHSSATAEMVDQRLERPARATWPSTGARRRTWPRSTRTSCTS